MFALERFPLLFSPIDIGKVTIRNRIASTGHAPGYAENGHPTERYRRYEAAKAAGGAALVIFGGATSVHATSPATEWSLITNRDDSIIPYYREMADAIHAHGAAVFTQITHLGRRARSDTEDWLPLLAPSQVPEADHHEVPHELDERTILELIKAYADAARRCKEGGLDGVEVHAANNQLVDQFWSPRINRRSDHWGGSFDNRMRFALSVLEACREAVGDDFVLGIRITGDEYLEGGLGLDAMRQIAETLARSRTLSYVNVIGGSSENLLNLAAVIPNLYYPPAPYVQLAAAIKEVVDLPILHAGKIADPAEAERVLSEGLADIVGMTRALIADPEMPAKAREGRDEDIRPCVGANEGCIDRLYAGKAITCIHNPLIGREAELTAVEGASSPRRVLVVGGGPGGLEAARVAQLRGHDVTLVERASELGGQVLTAARAPMRQPMAEIVRWLERQVRHAGVDVQLETEATEALVDELAPEVIVVATGARPYIPELPGFDAARVVTAEQVLRGEVDAGPRTVVVDDDGHYTAPSAAEVLARAGSSVEIVTTQHHLGVELGNTTRPLVLARIYAAGVGVTADTEARSLDGTTLHLRNLYSGGESEREVDTVVLAMGRRSVDFLYRTLVAANRRATYAIGDCVAPRPMGIHHAILEGTRVARLL